MAGTRNTGTTVLKQNAKSGATNPRKLSSGPASETFASLQAELLGDQAKNGTRVAGRERINRIIGAAVELLQEHKPVDVTIIMIAERAGITRTSIYAHFISVEEIFEQISIRFVEQSGLYVERYVREREPKSLQDVVKLVIHAIQDYFNKLDGKTLESSARNVPFQVRNVIKDFDKLAALPYHTLWKTDWPIKPLSEDDPFRILVVMQSALFEISIQRYGKITDQYVDEAISMASDFIRRTDEKFQKPGQTKVGPAERITRAVRKLSSGGAETFLQVAADQIEILVTIRQKEARKKP